MITLLRSRPQYPLLVALGLVAGAGCAPSAPSRASDFPAALIELAGQPPVHFTTSEYLTPWYGHAAEQLAAVPPEVLADARPALVVDAPHHFQWQVKASTGLRRLRGSVRFAHPHPEQPIHVEVFWTAPGTTPFSLWSQRLEAAPDQVSAPWSEFECSLPPGEGVLEFIARSTLPGGSVVSTDLGMVAWQLPDIVAEAPSGDLPDVLLLTIDTLRADAMAAAPALSDLFARGERWTAIAPSNWTLPSYASLFTGLPADQHGAGRGPFTLQATGQPEDRKLTGLKPGLQTLAERFREAGYGTAMFHQNPMLESWTGLNRGFQQYVRCGPNTRSALQQAGIWWQHQAGRPRFLVVHLMAPHLPYAKGPEPDPLSALDTAAFFLADHTPEQRAAFFDLSEQDRERVRMRYLAEVTALDETTAAWLKELQTLQSGPLVLALHADHGEELWDDGSFEHGHSFTPSVVEVPLALLRPNGPSILHPERVAAEELGAALLDAAGIHHDLGVPFQPRRSLTTSMPYYRAKESGRVYGAEERGLPFDPHRSAGGPAATISSLRLRQLQELGYLADQQEKAPKGSGTDK